MQTSSYRGRDYAFGRLMLTRRTAIGLTQGGLADVLGVSRRAVAEWESGGSYPKFNHFAQFLTLLIRQKAFPPGREAEEIRDLWRAAHQKVLLDESWLAALLASQHEERIDGSTPVSTQDSYYRPSMGHNRLIELPCQSTSFVGRIAELDHIAELLDNPICRLVTLTGPGGIGKTRLAIESASRQAGRYSDGVAFVSLAAISVPNQLVSAISDAVHLSLVDQPNPAASLLNHLGSCQLFLVLDNFEHLLEGAGFVSDILRRAPGVTMLVTSRERLNLQGEWLFDVDGLPCPPEEDGKVDTSQHAMDLAEYDAVQLFIQRARQIWPSLSLSSSSLMVIARICQRVGGMPLAIELAAARVSKVRMAQIEAGTHSNLDSLTTTLRDVPARHRSIRAALDQSWSLLTEPERTAFSRLAVFRGGVTVSAAKEVAGATLQTLQALVEKSLLRPVDSAAQIDANRNLPRAQVEPRFVLIELIREYALEKLLASDEAEDVRARHARYYLALGVSAAPKGDSPAIDLLDREQDNLRAALQWARDDGHLTVGLQLCDALWRFWRGRSANQEGRAWVADMLASEETTSDPSTIALKVRAMHAAAWLASDEGDFAAAERLFEQSRMLEGTLGETGAEAGRMTNAARHARAIGQYQAATEMLEEAVAKYRAEGNHVGAGPSGLGCSLYTLALVCREQGDFVRATAILEDHVDFHRAIGDYEELNSGLLGLGDIARDQGDVKGIRAYAEPALVFYRGMGYKRAIGFSLNNLAQAALLEGDLAQALALVSESEQLLRTIADKSGLSEVLITMGAILQAQGDLLTAYQVLTEALNLASVAGPRLMVAAAMERLGCVLIQSEQAELATRLLGAASALHTQMGTRVRPVDLAGVDHAQATAQSILGAELFAALWPEARAQTLATVLSVIPTSIAS